jgi:alpha-tubulin suppressor-like RCC1 family protein
MHTQKRYWKQGVGFYLFVSVFCILTVSPAALFGSQFTAIAAGWDFSLALKSDGSIVGWGANCCGQATPPDGNNFIAIATGWNSSLALKSDGSIVAWGDNGDGDATPPYGNNFITVAAGGYHSLALKSDGSIVGWGRNAEGECNVPAGSNFIAIAAGGYHSLALKSDGSIVAWGNNGSGECNVPDGNNFIAIAAGQDFSLALKSDGSIVAWGDNGSGECNVPDGNNFIAIAAGYDFSLALKSDGSIVAWGENVEGQCNVPTGNNFIAIATEVALSLALKSDGSIVIWGDNTSVTKCSVAASQTQGWDEKNMKDYFSASGIADFPADRDDINFIKVTITDVCDDAVIYSQSLDFNDHNDVARKKWKYSYSHSIAKGKAGAITSLKIDFTQNPVTFSVIAKNIDLTGLGCPLRLGFTMGNYILSSQEVDETIVGSNEMLILTRLMRLYKDTLVVSKAKAKISTKWLGDSLSVSGYIAVADMDLDTNEPNLVNEDVNVVWGSSTFTIPAGNFKTSGRRHLYKCSKSHSAEDSNNLVTATIDLDQCTYSISVKDVNLDYADIWGIVTFGINFATPHGHFNKTVNVDLATGRSY